jgi:hypothetical protein
MFGSASQKPSGFSFGASNNAPVNNMSTPSFNFSSNNNNTATNNTLNKQSGFSFGNTTATQNNMFSDNTSSANAPKLGGFTINPTTQPTNTGLTASGNSGFSFGKNQSNPTGLSLNTTSKPSLFGNSFNNPSFGNPTEGFGFGQQQQQQQQQIANPSPYGVDFAKFSTTEMPASLTSASADTSKLKRRRRSSVSSLNENTKNDSLVGRIIDTFKTPSKYSIEDVRGLFTSTKNMSNNRNPNDKANLELNKYSTSAIVNIGRTPATKSEYRRLIIRSSKDAYTKYDEIDPNSVILSKRKNLLSNIIETKSKPEISKNVIDSFKPPSKRVKKDRNEDTTNLTTTKNELTFSKPLSEQLDIPKDVISDLANRKRQTESEYWCTPSIEALSALSSLDLTHVENFSVGRKGYGNLMFKYPVDLTAFEGNWDQLLGKTIIFQRRTLQVYPDESNKPNEGNGLNVPAVVTLENVFPRNYNTLDPNLELLERHIQRLKSTHGMKFISFDPINGNYVFEVEHFSIWGIVDEDDDDPEIVARWQKQQELEYNNEKRRNELQINALEKIAGYGQPGDNWKRQKPDFGVTSPGVFEIDDKVEENKGLLLAQDNFDTDSIVDASVPSGLENNERITDEINESDKKLAIINANSDAVDELVEIRAYEPEVKDINMQFLNSKMELPLSENWDEQLRLSSGFFSVFNKNLNPSYNVKLDPQNVGQLIFGDKDTSELPKAIVEGPISFENIDNYRKCLQTEIFDKKFNLRSNDLPLISLDDEINLETPLFSFENSSDYTSWELLSILYDDNYVKTFLSESLTTYTSSSSPKMKYILDLKRRELLCCFFQRIITMNIEQNSFEVPSLLRDNVDKIYHFLCIDKLADAIQYAINTRNNHLAVLLTMLDSNDATTQKLATSQLDEWSNGKLNFIPSGVLKVYKLLTGDILSKKYINHLDGLTWPVVLYLLIKYGESNQPLKKTISQFIEYAENTGIFENPIYQTYYTLLKIFNDEYEFVFKFDVEFQFLLMKHLKPSIQFTSDEFDDVVTKFSKKLEKKGLVEEASFVLEHLIDDTENELLIAELFNNNVSEFKFLNDDLKLKKLHATLSIPYSLLHQARSVEFNKLKEYYKSTLELILADKLSDAHNLLLEHVAPDIIIGNVPRELNKLANLIEEFSTLSNFKIGADIYGEYIRAIEISLKIDYNDVDYKQKCDELNTIVDSIIDAIPSLVEFNPKVKIAKTLMLKKLISIAFKEGLKCDSQKLLHLQLPESERNYLEAKYDEDSNNKMIMN